MAEITLERPVAKSRREIGRVYSRLESTKPQKDMPLLVEPKKYSRPSRKQAQAREEVLLNPTKKSKTSLNQMPLLST
jgi:hypothetical protein